jgi:hypothetical protein
VQWTICQQYRKATAGLPDYQANFQMLSKVASVANMKKWSNQASHAQRKRTGNIHEMDIFMAKDQTCI